MLKATTKSQWQANKNEAWSRNLHFFFFFVGVDKWGYLDLEYVIIFVYAIPHPTYTKFIMGRNLLGVGPKY